jgi:hypothetical protein
MLVEMDDATLSAFQAFLADRQRPRPDMTGRLVKWDAAIVGDHPPLDVDPMTHPGCLEVLDLAPGEPPNIRYRRPDPCL